MSFGEKIALSLFSSDWYILVAAIFTLVVGALSGVLSWTAHKFLQGEGAKKQAEFAKTLYSLLTVFYTLFITMISIFPLLGMFGTVAALLNLDFQSAEAISIARDSFFDALTSTAWGIIFAVMFKLANAFISTAVEGTIARLAEFGKRLDKKQSKRLVSALKGDGDEDT